MVFVSVLFFFLLFVFFLCCLFYFFFFFFFKQKTAYEISTSLEFRRVLFRSNPLALDKRSDELDTATWARVFREAAALGVLQVHLSGGEPAARRDLVEIVQAARDAGLYSNLITSAVGLTPQNLAALSDAGLDHVQISIQDSDEASANHIAGYEGASARKRALAKEVVSLGL